MTSTTVAVSQTQSLAAIRNFIRASISCITYARGLCNDSAFESKPFLGFELKHMVPKTLEAKTLSEWIEKGAFDALNRGFLKEMSLCVYNPDCSELLESYCFSFVYNDDKQRATLGLSSEQYILPDRKTSFIIPCKDEKELCEKNIARRCNNLLTQRQMSQISGQFSRRSKDEVQKMLAILLSRLLEVVESLPPLLTERVLTMRLTYYDKVVPASYEPPCFAPATNHMVLMYKDELTHNVQLGVANTGHHIFTIAVRHPLLASIHNRLKRKRHSANKSACTEVCNHKFINSKQNQTQISCSSYNTRSTDVPSYNTSTNNDNTQINKRKLAAALASTNEEKAGAAVKAAPSNVNRNISKQDCILAGSTLEEHLQKHTHSKNEFNALLEHDCCIKSVMFDRDCECNSSEILYLVNIPTLRELMTCSLHKEINQCNHIEEIHEKPALFESTTQQSSSSLSSEPSRKFRLIDITYLLLVCFAFTKSPAVTNGRGSFTSKDLDEYLNHSCPLGLSPSQGLHLMDKLVEEQYLTKTVSSSSVKKRACANLEDIHNAINDTPSKRRSQNNISNNNFGKINNANCNIDCKHSSQIKGEGTIPDVMMFEKSLVPSNATIVVEWKFLSDPPEDVVEWLLSQHRVMELLSPTHYGILIELAQTLKKKS